MAKVCAVCNKGVVSGHRVSHAVNHNKRKWAPNLRRVKAIIDGSPRRIRVCTRCLRSGRVQRAL